MRKEKERECKSQQKRGKWIHIKAAEEKKRAREVKKVRKREAGGKKVNNQEGCVFR